MDWHRRYLQQASWTRELRAYLFREAHLEDAAQVLEVGCGTGAVLADFIRGATPTVHGLDIDLRALQSCRQHVPGAMLTRGDAHRLPYTDGCFDLTSCHFLLLWLADPSGAIREMRRVTKRGGRVLAIAEPDYARREDQPGELANLGKWQREALVAQGADPSIGSRIADLFHRAGLRIMETGMLSPRQLDSDGQSEWAAEWAVLRADLAARVPAAELDRLEALDALARRSGKRRLHVPTYFVHAQV